MLELQWNFRTSVVAEQWTWSTNFCCFRSEYWKMMRNLESSKLFAVKWEKSVNNQFYWVLIEEWLQLLLNINITLLILNPYISKHNRKRWWAVKVIVKIIDNTREDATNVSEVDKEVPKTAVWCIQQRCIRDHSGVAGQCTPGMYSLCRVYWQVCTVPYLKVLSSIAPVSQSIS